MLGIVELAEPARVVEQGEQEDELGVAANDERCQLEACPGDGLPVLLAVIG